MDFTPLETVLVDLAESRERPEVWKLLMEGKHPLKLQNTPEPQEVGSEQSLIVGTLYILIQVLIEVVANMFLIEFYILVIIGTLRVEPFNLVDGL